MAILIYSCTGTLNGFQGFLIAFVLEHNGRLDQNQQHFTIANRALVSKQSPNERQMPQEWHTCFFVDLSHDFLAAEKEGPAIRH